MPCLPTQIESGSERFRANHARMAELATALRSEVARASRGGSEEARRKHTARGKLLPRERVRTLLDPGSPFLELSALAA